MKVLLDENFPDARIRQRLTDGDLIFLTQDEDFLSGEAVAATIVVSRVRQVRSLAERIQVWRAAVQTLASMDRTTRLFELTDEGALVPWGSSVLAFIRDHVEAGETYRLDAAALEFGELLPAMPGWLAQDEYEKQTAVGFGLERLTKTVDGLATTTSGLLHSYASAQRANSVPGGETIEETDEFITTRVDTGGGPEIIAIQRK